MEPGEALSTAAQIAVAIAGFAVRDYDIQELSPA
jgi:hypothetical protein